MNITITGRHEGVGTAVRDYAHDKLSKILRIHDRISSAHMTLDQDHGQYVVDEAPREPNPEAKDAALREDLWALSASLCGVSPEHDALTS